MPTASYYYDDGRSALNTTITLTFATPPPKVA
jgi:hypothetical protein